MHMRLLHILVYVDEARKTNFTVFSVNHELYNLINAFNMKLEST